MLFGRLLAPIFHLQVRPLASQERIYYHQKQLQLLSVICQIQTTSFRLVYAFKHRGAEVGVFLAKKNALREAQDGFQCYRMDFLTF